MITYSAGKGAEPLFFLYTLFRRWEKIKKAVRNARDMRLLFM
ncbi:hypothetical protein B4092_3929 [Bacillus licheniformis]|nr:hypothetical protein B4092_3929 [Bacillus licheniformis]TWJ63301.1 hypothetical protein CHCC5020_0765 [Bacillus licheniformis]TWK32271.1 hypothetical protein CHCC20369_2820 [Bacillus licheniformis]TWK36651.1 hypothetical protein CHCC20368_1176 [Bacillus licheniformis]TWN13173.1 hypothetical protein CHCC14561_0871 [Bacillus licheniformis]